MQPKNKTSVLSRNNRWFIASGAMLCILVAVLILIQPVGASRFLNRGMYINSGEAGATTYYIVTLEFPSANSVGALRMEFCDNPIPSLPCTVPAGLDVSNAVLSAESGEMGFTVADQTNNLVILGRPPTVTSIGNLSSYRLDNVVNPTSDTQDFYVRLTSHATLSDAQTDPQGTLIDFGSVSAMLTPDLGFATQVPPVLIFCVAETVTAPDCSDATGNFKDLGEIDSSETYAASNQMLARTNAQYGLAVAVTGKTFTSGIRSIPVLTSPTQSFVGVGQFGMNIVENTNPTIGQDPDTQATPGTNLALNPNYTTPNYFMFNSGDILVSSDGTTRTQRLTASYILNVPEDQHPGVYSTTLTYTCVAGF